ncbi:MAG: hypothetical protein HYZ53_05475 [Planctomycetes bacterium]|nr:hypothetical protein [Planctomycetota bacterium]
MQHRPPVPPPPRALPTAETAARLALVFLCALLACPPSPFSRLEAAPPAPARPDVGVLDLLSELDAAAGYEGTEDDFQEAAAAGITLATHELHGESDYSDLSSWLGRHPELKARLEALKTAHKPQLAWAVFQSEMCLADSHRATQGKLKLVVGQLFPLLVPDKKAVDAEAVSVFAGELLAAEKERYPGTIGGWLLTDGPNDPRNAHEPAAVAALAAAVREAEKKGGYPAHRLFVGLSAADPPDRNAPFVACADVVLVSPDALLWNRTPAARVDDPVYETLPRSAQLVRDLAEKAKRKDVKVHLALQAFDRVEDEFDQPGHFDMHQQLRMALSPALANRGPYARTPRLVQPADGLWLASWREFKRKLAGKAVNRWDDPDGTNWREALEAELAGAPGAVHVVKDETWSGVVHVAGDVIVHKGAALTLKPGTVIRFSPVDHFSGGQDKTKCELVVEGRVVSQGNEQQRVEFTSDADNAGFTTAPRKGKHGDWLGIRLAGGKVEGKNYVLQCAASDHPR